MRITKRVKWNEGELEGRILDKKWKIVKGWGCVRTGT